MQEIFYRYNPWWENGYKSEKYVERPKVLKELYESMNDQSIVILTGLRRVGKTTLMKQVISRLIEVDRIDPKYIFYISMDDYLLAGKNILEIVEEYRRIWGLSFSDKVYLFLDEITYQKDFEVQLKNIYDHHQAKVYVSSSSASVLKSKKSFLTGRNKVIEVLPLDFEDYLVFKKIIIKKADGHLLEKHFEDFMQTGGMPEYVLTNNIEYLKELVDDIIQKDIAAFHGVRDVQVLKDYFLLLMERSGKVVSINKMAKILDIAPDTAKRYFQMFTDSYLIYPVARFGKTNERLLSAKKIYAADLGIRTLFTGFRDKGSLFENYVYLKIRKFEPFYVYQEKNEIDFVIGKKILIEVKYNSEMNEGQRRLFDEFKIKKKLVVDGIRKLGELDFLSL